MTDGLEIQEKQLSEIIENKDGRIDSQFWTATITENTRYVYKKIGDVLKQSQYGISIEMNEDGNGYPIYRMNEIHNSVCDLEVKKYADITPQEFEIFKLNDGDVLFNRTNSYEWVGRTGIYYKASERDDKVFASYLVRLIPDTEYILPEYLTAFLNTEIATHQIKVRARQSINQTNVNPEEVKEIAIPLLCKELQTAIQKNYNFAYADLIAAKKAYAQAEAILNTYLNIRDYDDNGYAVKTLSDSFMQSGRLDAEYYQSKYNCLIAQINTTEIVSSLCNVFNENFVPDDKVEYKYIELANVGVSGDISNVETIIGIDLPSRARRLVRKGQVIISSIEGSLSSCALVDDEYDGALCSTGFYVINSGKINSETLLVLFKSKPIQLLLKQRCSGTILTAISKDEFFNMPLPTINDAVQKEIADKVHESFRLRKEAKRLLDNAIKAVEMAIETDEESALLWLQLKA